MSFERYNILSQDTTTSEGGGFLTGADDVVQAFSLPKYQHLNLPFNPIASKQQKQQAARDDYADDPGHTMPEYVTYDIETMDVDPAEVGNSPEIPTPITIVPMTMQELAEAAAKKQSVGQGTSNLGTVEGIQAADTVAVEQAARQSTPSTSAKSMKRAALTTKGRGSAKPRTAVGRSRSSQKRKRSGEDSGIDSGEPNPDGDDFKSDHTDENDVLQPKKRNRTLARMPASSPSTRVLRPRRSKTGMQLAAVAD